MNEELKSIGGRRPCSVVLNNRRVGYFLATSLRLTLIEEGIAI